MVRNSYKKDSKTIPGTRSFHQFFVHNENVIKCKHISFENSCAINFDLKGKVGKSWISDIYVAFFSKESWQLGFIISSNEDDLE